MRAMDCLERVAVVKLKGDSGQIWIRFEELHTNEGKYPEFTISVRRSAGELGGEQAPETRRVSVHGFTEIRFVDTTEQQRLRSLNKWFALIEKTPPTLETEEARTAWAMVHDPIKEQRDALLASGVTEYGF
ncbi:MAG: hypothetical protein ACQEXV_24000 [Bacillota bacterium]